MVFSGVILYKFVFHLEQAEKAETAAVREKDAKENVGRKLMHDSGDDFKDEPDEIDYVPIRAVELVDRNTSKSSQVRTKMILGHDNNNNNHGDDDNNNDDVENGYVMPSTKLV